MGWLLPQNWAFFTNNPQDTFAVPYRHTATGWSETGTGPLAEPGNAFGFDRAPRMQDADLNMLLTYVPANAWHACAPGTALSAVASCLDADTATVAATTPSAGVDTGVDSNGDPDFCGDIAIATAHVSTWPGTGQPTVLAQSVARIEAPC
jgi:antimicrobial peptide system SdpA family protein